MSWVGVNITQMKDTMGNMKVEDAVVRLEVDHLHQTFSEYTKECDRRWATVQDKLDRIYYTKPHPDPL